MKIARTRGNAVRERGLDNRWATGPIMSEGSLTQQAPMQFPSQDPSRFRCLAHHTNQRWPGIRLDGLGILLTFSVSMLAVSARFTISPSLTGLVLAYVLTVQQAF